MTDLIESDIWYGATRRMYYRFDGNRTILIESTWEEASGWSTPSIFLPTMLSTAMLNEVNELVPKLIERFMDREKP